MAGLACGLCLAILGAGCTGAREAKEERKSTVKRVYHVQIRMTERKAVADQTVGEAKSWWRERSAAERPRALTGMDELPVSIAWRPPLYRVRIGPFASRQRAEVMLTVVDGTYPDAFIAPQRVQTQRRPQRDAFRPFARSSRY
jgi:hypothetical protein